MQEVLYMYPYKNSKILTVYKVALKVFFSEKSLICCLFIKIW